MIGGVGIAMVALLWLLAITRISVVASRMFQIEEYEALRLWRWANVRAWNWHRALAVASAAALVLAGVAVLRNESYWVIAEGLTGTALLNLLWRWLPPKKALVWTPRMRRLFATTVVLAVVLTAAVAILALRSPVVVGAVAVWVGIFMASTIPVFLFVIANWLMAPVEAGVRCGFIRRARRRLAAVDPVVVAVAGSWGKTSTKHILAQLLPAAAFALPTPRSFNTLMGVTRTVNENLADSHKTFIVEMDAYAPGEIASICDLVHPRLAIVTAVGPQHLERFGSIERIADALYETVAALPPEGVAIIYAGDPSCAALALRAVGEKRRVVTYAMEGEGVNADISATDVRVDGGGSHFMWRWGAEQLETRVDVPLLGRHQVLNVSAALAAVHLLGFDAIAAVSSAARLQPVEHRLQPVPSGHGVVVIDDSYNANPVGVHNGLDVLSALGEGKRILVTPGLVELGAEEDAENRRYGEHAARVCDHVIVVRAKTTEALLAGLGAGGIDAKAVHVVASLAEATTVIGSLARRGDVVLFANDLPDTY